MRCPGRLIGSSDLRPLPAQAPLAAPITARGLSAKQELRSVASSVSVATTPITVGHSISSNYYFQKLVWQIFSFKTDEMLFNWMINC